MNNYFNLCSLIKVGMFSQIFSSNYKVFIQSTQKKKIKFKKKKTIHAIDPFFPITFPFLQRLLTCYIAKEEENLLIQYTF